MAPYGPLIPRYGAYNCPPWLSTPLAWIFGKFYVKLADSFSILLKVKLNMTDLYWYRLCDTWNSLLNWVRMGLWTFWNSIRIFCASVNISSLSSNPVNMDWMLVRKFSKEISLSWMYGCTSIPSVIISLLYDWVRHEFVWGGGIVLVVGLPPPPWSLIMTAPGLQVTSLYVWRRTCICWCRGWYNACVCATAS